MTKQIRVYPESAQFLEAYARHSGAKSIADAVANLIEIAFAKEAEEVEKAEQHIKEVFNKDKSS